MSISLTYSIADQSLRRSKSVGILNVSVNLLRQLALRPEVERLTILGNSTFDPQAFAADGRVSWLPHDEVLKSPLHRMIWDQWRVYSAGRESGNRWLFVAKGFASFIRKPCSLLACVLYDGMHDYYREHYPRGFSRFEMFYFLNALKATIRHADVIFTISEFTTSEVLRIARLHESGPRENSIVILSSRWPHKRTDLALAYMQAWQARTGFKGPVYWVGTLPAGVGLPPLPNWSFRPRLSFEEYGRMLSRARALVYFSDYEGFGMPPIEALLAGASPVYSDIPVTREVMAGAGCPFSNGSADSFGAALDRALDIPADALAAWLAELLQRHSWSKVCSKVVEGLAAVESAKKGPECS